jgi:cytochrome c oxidase subunit 1
MSGITIQPGDLPSDRSVAMREHYLNVKSTVASWLLTVDHKRIAILYMVSITIFFGIGGFAALGIRLALTSYHDTLFASETYNKLFTIHGVVMIFFFLIPSIPAVLGNFLIPLMIGARDLAFPRLNLFSWYLYTIAGILGVIAICCGGVETGWTFYTPYSSMYANSNVVLTIAAAFIAGFSSIATGINFIVTIHKMRAPGMTWFRMPLFVWAHYATSLVQILGTPVVAITLLLVVAERTLNLGIFNPANGGDPLLFQHLFWFYSHPAVYIMILPGMGVISELIAAFSRKRIFGYSFVAFSSIAIAILGFLVWGHHMFITGQSMYSGMVFSLLSFLIAVPSAIKVFNWTATIYKGNVWWTAPMLYALGFIGLFTIGGLTGLYLSSLATDVHLNMTYFVVAHFHYVMVGGATLAYLGGIHFWWPKMTGRMYPEGWAKVAAALTFVGFNLTFFPQFIIGYMGMPRRYHYYPQEFQGWHIMSSAGSTVLGLAYIIPIIYLAYSLKYGPIAGPNPWGAKGLEWTVPSPPGEFNFDETPIVTDEAYAYFDDVEEEAQQDRRDIGAHEAVEEEADNDRFLTADPPSEGTR